MSTPDQQFQVDNSVPKVEYAIVEAPTQMGRGPQDIVSSALTPAQITKQVQLIQQVMKDHMQVDEHYGVIPGTLKPTLYQAGAQKLALLFRLGVRPTVTFRVIEKDFIFYEVRVDVYHIPTGQHVSAGMGSCSSREEKYAYRNAARKCPSCGNEAIIQGKVEYAPKGPGYAKGGFVCFKKKGGCGKAFRDDDETITKQKAGKIPNENIWELHNTILKIAVKRACNTGVLNATAASDIFTVDVEDLPPEYLGDPGPSFKQSQQQTPPEPPPQPRGRPKGGTKPQAPPEEQVEKATAPASAPATPPAPAATPAAPAVPLTNQAKSEEIKKRSGCNQTTLIMFVRDMVRKCTKNATWDLPPKTDAQRGLVSQILDVLVEGLERIPSASIGAFIHGQPISEAERAIMQEVWKEKVR